MGNGRPPHLIPNLNINLKIEMPKRKSRSEMRLLNTLQMKYYGTNFTEHAGDVSHMPINFALIEDLPDAASVTAEKLDEVITDYVKSLPDHGAWPDFVLGGDDREAIQ